MLWIVWALMLVTHGAFARWAETARHYAAVSLLADILLVTIGLITLQQIQDLGVAEILRLGLFFVAFGTAGRQIMNGIVRYRVVTK
jgi:hypothetical protein